MLSNTKKTAALYLIVAIFVAIGLFFLIKKDTYLAFAVPIVIGVQIIF